MSRCLDKYFVSMEAKGNFVSPFCPLCCCVQALAILLEILQKPKEIKPSSIPFRVLLIHVCNNILYSLDRGIYEDTPKTSTSNRYVVLPAETM